jgi:hypothetical protein
MIRTTLIVLEMLIGVSALAGGVYAVSGARGISRDWLEGSPFKSYFVPGLALFFVVGGSILTAAGLLLGDVPSGRLVSLEAGIVLVAWIVGQVSVIGYRSWLQPVLGVLGLVVVVLSFLLPSPG